MNGPGSLSFSGRGWLSFHGLGTPTPTPPLTNLAAWWRSDGPGNTASGGIATKLADQSGGGNDGTVSGGFVGPKVEPAIVNGLPGFNCFYSGTPITQMGGAGRLLPDGSAFYVATIARMSPVSAGLSPGGFTTGGGLGVFDGSTALDLVFGNYAGDVYITPSVTGAGVALVNDGTYFEEIGCDGATLTAAINGTPLALTSTVPLSPSGAGWILFDDAVGNGPLWAWWVETLLYSADLSGPDLAQLRLYLHFRSGV